MKKVVILLVAGLMLAACSDKDQTAKQSDPDKTPAATETEGNTNSNSANDQVGLEEGLKGDSEEVDYGDIAKGDVPANKKVKFTGTIVEIEDGRFGLKNDMNDSSEEVLWIDDIRLGERTEIPEGTTVIVYGSYTGMDEQNAPKINAIFIDPK